MHILVLGAGGWGTALASLLASTEHRVTLWSNEPDCADIILATRENLAYLPGVRLPASIGISADLGALDRADLVILSTPTQFIRPTILRVPRAAIEGAAVVGVAKGIENGTNLRVSEILAATIGLPPERYAVLTGPSHAEEVSRGVPTAVVAASTDPGLARSVQALFSTPSFRVYRSADVVGAELGGALKNVIALSAGVSDGAGFGDNTKAAVMTRGLAEMSRFGAALGADPATFAGLSGLGDLVVTCMSRHSRNRRVGEMIGKGMRLEAILAEMKMVAEGVPTTSSAHALARSAGIDMPIVAEMHGILFEGKDPAAATRALMTREMKEE